MPFRYTALDCTREALSLQNYRRAGISSSVNLCIHSVSHLRGGGSYPETLVRYRMRPVVIGR